MQRMLVDLLVSAPLLFAGVQALTDPAGFIYVLRNLGRGVDRFSCHLQGRQGVLPPVDDPISRNIIQGTRIFGVLIVAAVVVCLTAR
jgi:hypothetical protein